MKLTMKQCDLLMNMVNASIKVAMDSGIPIGKEYYEDIDTIKEQIMEESLKAYKRKEEVKHDSNC